MRVVLHHGHETSGCGNSRSCLSCASPVGTIVPVSITSAEMKGMKALPLSALREFFKMEAAGGILLVLAAALALAMANSPLEHYYHALLGTKAEVRVGAFSIAKPLTCGSTTG